MVRAWALAVSLSGSVFATAPARAEPSEARHVQRLAEWRFMRGAVADAASPLLDDEAWPEVRVPHDWAIALPMDPSGDSNSKFNWHGEGWYRYHLTPDAADAGREFYLDFDGAMAFPKVYVNGQLAGEWDYGYNSFRVDATPFLQLGRDNVIAVHIDTRDHWSRWYSGAGLYRKVTLSVEDPVHVAHWGSYVTTPKISAERAEVKLELTVENSGEAEGDVLITTELYAPEGGRPVAQVSSRLSANAGGTAVTTQFFNVAQPKLWDLATPNLYTARTALTVAGKTRDTYTTTFGIRSLVFTKDQGLLLNGHRVQLHGADLHHDQGPLGAAFHRRAAERQLQMMKDMGVNAIRTSHNPAAPELLDLADHMGLLVFAECFDKWDQTSDRLPNVPLATYGQKQISQFIRRDRNHPSIMIWSIGNEIWDIESNVGGNAAAQVKMMAGFVHAADPTRPVTMATHMVESLNSGLHQYLDVQSWNYGRKYVPGRQRYPNMPVMMSESASAVSTRGDYALPLPPFKDLWPSTPTLSSYDLYAVSWGDIADVEFQAIAAHPYVAGEFVWSGFDYIGEPSPYDDISRSSYFGIVDLVGIPKDRYYLYRSFWRPEEETTHILPHWTWPDKIGQTVPVFVYTSGDSAELFLNGRSLGKRTKLAPDAPLPPNLALDKPTSASSEETAHGNTAERAVDGDANTRWCAADGSAGVWWQVDLGEPERLKTVFLNFEQNSTNYQYQLQGSLDGRQWQTLASKTDFAAGAPGVSLNVDAVSRYLRVSFPALKPGVWASLRKVEAYSETVDRSYFAVTRSYRLRWDEVPYEPGELTAVSYRGEERLGVAHVRTAAPPTRLQLEADRTAIASDGDDLSFVTVTARDEYGTIDPDGTQLVHLDLAGPGELMGVGNGDPNSTDNFVARDIHLFHGRAVAIVRGLPRQAGQLQVTASAPGLKPGGVLVLTEDARSSPEP